MPECEDRRLYEIQSRNLTVGAFRAATNGFIGLRLKLGSVYLFEEFHYDLNQRLGTARPLRALDVVVPHEIALAEYLPSSDSSKHHGSWCTEHDREVEYRTYGSLAAVDQPRESWKKGYWVHLDDGTELSATDHPAAKANTELYELLMAHTDWAQEWAKERTP